VDKENALGPRKPSASLEFTARVAQTESVRACFAIFLVTLAASLSTSAQPARSHTVANSSAAVQRLFEEGQNALVAGRWDAAEQKFKQVLAIDPNSAGAYSNLGTVHMKKKEWKQALAYLRQAQKLAPKVAGIRLNIGLSYYQQNDYRAAIPAFASALQLSDSDQARYLLGLCYFFTKQYAAAAQTLEPLWPQQSSSLSYLYVLGIAAHKAGLKELGDKALGALVSAGQDTAIFHLLLGKAYLNEENYPQALKELERAAEQDASLPYLHFTLGSLYLRQQELAKAEAEFLKDAAIESDVPFNYDQLGVIYSQLQRNDEAAENFRKAIKIDPSLTSSYFGLAKIYQRQGRYADALAALASAERLEPKNSSVHYLAGQILARLGRSQKAKAEFDRSSQLLAARRDQQREHLGEDSSDQELLKAPQ
jgi:tetratricopeptide (TPR) repeat protein